MHVPLAIVALLGFVAAGVFGDRAPAHARRAWDHALLRRDPHERHLRRRACWSPARSGPRASWGKWWVWDEPTLVSFLIVFLLYVTYYPLRYSIEDPERRARYASVFAITAGAFVPINFIAVRLAESLVHPRVLNATAGDMPGEMRLTFLVALAGIALLYVTLVKLELTSKHARGQLKAPAAAARGRTSRRPARTAPPLATVPARPRARRRAMPALPLDEAGKYVAGAYGVFVTLILVYVAIMAARLQRIERELQALDRAGRAQRRARRRTLIAQRADSRAALARPMLDALAQARPALGDAALLPGDPRPRRPHARSWSAPARSARARSRAC